jgi:hypothetical protein
MTRDWDLLWFVIRGETLELVDEGVSAAHVAVEPLISLYAAE